MSIELVILYNRLILCHSLFLLPSVFTRIFSNESALCIKWPKYWSFSFNVIIILSQSLFCPWEICSFFTLVNLQHVINQLFSRPDDQSPLACPSSEFLSGCFDHRNAGLKVSPSLWKLQPSVMDTECNFHLEQVFDFCMVITSYIACSTTWGKKKCILAPDIFPVPRDLSNIH